MTNKQSVLAATSTKKSPQALISPRLKFQTGFTLVELLVVISIIGVLAGLLLINFVGVRGRAADAKAKSDLAQFQKALRLYYNDYAQYPVGTGGTIAACGSDGTTACSSTGTFSAGSPATLYMNYFPEGMEYYNGAATDPDTYVLVTTLATAADQDVAASQARCASVISEENLTLEANEYTLCEN